MPSPWHSGNQDEAVHPPLDSANCSEKDRLERAIGQYHHALQHWEFGNVRIPSEVGHPFREIHRVPTAFRPYSDCNPTVTSSNYRPHAYQALPFGIESRQGIV